MCQSLRITNHLCEPSGRICHWQTPTDVFDDAQPLSTAAKGSSCTTLSPSSTSVAMPAEAQARLHLSYRNSKTILGAFPIRNETCETQVYCVRRMTSSMANAWSQGRQRRQKPCARIRTGRPRQTIGGCLQLVWVTHRQWASSSRSSRTMRFKQCSCFGGDSNSSIRSGTL